MADREHPRMPYVVQVEFRTPSSFLVAYSVNLSRGGMFVETEADVPVGAGLTIELAIPNHGTLELDGIVAWRRVAEAGADGPPGLGVEFQDVAPALGALIDKLVTGFRGVQILLLSGDRQDRTTLARNIKSIVSTAEITQAADVQVASTVLTGEIDLAIIDVDFDLDGAIKMLQSATQQQPRVPTIALSSNPAAREQAVKAGADEILPNPPPFPDLQVVLVRALGKPLAVRAVATPSVDVDV